MDLCGTEVGVERECLAEAEESHLRALGSVGVVPFRTTDGAEQDGVGRFSDRERVSRERGAARVERGAADQRLREIKCVTKFGADGAEDAHALGDDLGSYAIAGQYTETCLHTGFIVTIRARGQYT